MSRDICKEFIVSGGGAARLHDTGHATVDIDICPSSVVVNLERLAAALRSINTRLRVEGDPAGIPALRPACVRDARVDPMPQVPSTSAGHAAWADGVELAGEHQCRAADVRQLAQQVEGASFTQGEVASSLE